MPIIECSYYFQRDNPSGEGERECGGTSNAAFLNQLTKNSLDIQAKEEGISQPEWIYLKRLRDFGDTTDHDANTRCLRSFGVESSWYTDLTNQDYMRLIDAGIAPVLGFNYKESGHIVHGVGYRPRNEKLGQKWVAYINDPNGSRRESSDSWISNSATAGKLDVYSENTFNLVWEGHLGRGWGRIPHSINGVPTGFKR